MSAALPLPLVWRTASALRSLITVTRNDPVAGRANGRRALKQVRVHRQDQLPRAALEQGKIAPPWALGTHARQGTAGKHLPPSVGLLLPVVQVSVLRSPQAVGGDILMGPRARCQRDRRVLSKKSLRSETFSPTLLSPLPMGHRVSDRASSVCDLGSGLPLLRLLSPLVASPAAAPRPLYPHACHCPTMQ